ncbi:MAG: DUF3179 domain-containing protein [Fuerstiella sp.]|nr:DUF3179 domain-containing protein [Fuerstiella sp.]MCP4508276.1 DUF3179 domain-containing protein [Fuerstiella sp.]MCP4783171.1 DUF3179 domain-containing protein [Fuerstiella sp.]MCP4854399.1 DUF3179 domain-containing protein [Fuerstiella sp.]
MSKWLKIACGCAGVSVAFAVWQTVPHANSGQPLVPVAQSGDPVRYDPRQVLRKPIRPITDPTITGAEATDTAPNELVIGVRVNGAARAYPINQLTGPKREIINDMLGGTAIAATW